MKVFNLLVCSLIILCCAHVSDIFADVPDAKPVDPVDAIIEAFETHMVVALCEGTKHRCVPGHMLRLALIHDPRFPKAVNDIVVEWGNALYQSIMDRYISGKEVPYEELSQVWMKTTQTHGIWNAPIYHEFFCAVRDLNKTLPKERRIRVLLFCQKAKLSYLWDIVRYYTGISLGRKSKRRTIGTCF